MQTTIRFVCAVAVAILPLMPSLAMGQTHPRQYVQVYEVRDSNDALTRDLGRAMDQHNNIMIDFDPMKLRDAMSDHGSDVVTIRVEASLQRGDGTPQPIEVENFITVREESSEYSFVYHDKEIHWDAHTDELTGILPDSFINLSRLGVAVGDRVHLKITDIETQNELNFISDVRAYGWENSVVDSFLLLYRPVPDESDAATINFRPAPGTTLGWLYRGREDQPFWNVLTPGLGYNVSFMNWDSSTDFDVATGKFKSTSGNDVQIGFGFVLTLLDNTLHLTYGWNLNVESEREYYGIGFSFFNLGQRIGGLVGQ